MPRPQLIRTSDFAYHVTSRSNNQEWFYLDQRRCWEIFCLTLARSAERYDVHIHAFVLMSNHFHLIISTPNENLDQFMRHFLTETSRAIQRETGRINHIFGGRYRWSVLDSAFALAYVLKYVYRNPVRAGICESVDQYPFSTFVSNSPGPIPLSEGFNAYWSLIPKGYKSRLLWLNMGSNHEKLISLGLRRYQFRFSSHSNNQARVRSLHAEYGVIHPAPFGTESR